MKLTIAAIIRSLREAGRDSVEDLFPGVFDPEDTVECEAADLIEEWAAILRKVVDGDPDAPRLAAAALNDQQRVIDGLKAYVDKLTKPKEPG